MLSKYVTISITFLVSVISVIMFASMNPSTKLRIIHYLLFLIAELLFLSSAFYLWRKTNQILNRKTFQKTPRLKNLRLFILALLIFIIFVANMSFYFLVSKTSQTTLTLVCFVLLGFYIQFFTLFFCSKLTAYLSYKVSQFFTTYQKNPKTISLQINTFTYLLSLIVAFFLTFYGTYNALQDPQIKRVNVSIPHFPFPRFTILVFSDIHLGFTVNEARIQNVADLAKTLDYGLLTF